ncbi:hypothetical protein J3B01_005054 [Coemansia erecta]|nr:hypothetical protein J3B01_005054 [Coemansia erecta]
MRISLRTVFFMLCGLLGGLYLLSVYGALGRTLTQQPNVHSPQKPNEHSPEQQRRQKAVRVAMQHAWHGYRTHAFGHDELQPLTQSGNIRWGNWSISLLDALDSLKLMELHTEYAEAKAHVRNIDFTRSPHGFTISVFEMTIRALGGLLGAYELDHDPLLLQKAEEVGRTLARAFDTPTGLPYSQLDVNNPKLSGAGMASLAEAGTMQLEFKQLAQVSGKREFWDMAERVSDVLEAGSRTHTGLYPMYISVLTGQYAKWTEYTVGAMADSFYEYMLKQYIMHGDDKYRTRYIASVDAITSTLVGRTKGNLAFVGRLANDGRLVREMEHLACFYPGLLALGAQVLDRPQDLLLAEELTHTCFVAYNMTATGLGPEHVYFIEDGGLGISPSDSRYMLRPETVESLFVMYRITGDQKYQEWGWQIFESIEQYARVEHGYAALVNVLQTNMTSNLEDSMESFFLAETLKYLYLLFSPPTVLPLDEYVFTTEAHPFRIIK